ncbi:MAG: squalene synthase HpnC [Deltaproteobacteria bacterium]|nr:squalene synthase HpnC [Deltaproteobacteria bacterium]
MRARPTSPERRTPGTPSLGPWAPGSLPSRHAPWTPDAAIRYCEAMARSHYENFPVVFGLMTRPQREALAAVYAFARTADDFADEPEFDGVREPLLDAWEDRLRACFRGEADHPVFVALDEVRRRHGLPERPFLDLLDAFRQDCREQRYATFASVLDYCRRSANPVGRLVLHVLGLAREPLLGWSDRVCTALQLTNFWQDLSVDVPRGRLYLPVEDLDRFGIRPEDLLGREAPPRFGELLRLETERTRALFDEGRPLCTAAVHPGCLYFGAVWAGGRAVLALVEATGPAVLLRRPALSRAALAAIVVGLLRGAGREGGWKRG